MRTRPIPFSFAVAALCCQAAFAADGLLPPRSQDVWPQWQARVTVSTTALAPVSLTGEPQTRSALLGDYYFKAPGLRLPASMGGVRATSGLMFGSRGWGAAPPTDPTLPYVGLGYTGLAIKGGWGFTADLGLVAENPSGAGRFGRALLGNQNFDSALRELRFSPVLQVGVSYAF
jgi:hypothetical protein